MNNLETPPPVTGAEEYSSVGEYLLQSQDAAQAAVYLTLI